MSRQSKRAEAAVDQLCAFIRDKLLNEADEQLTQTTMPKLKLIAKGKVRDIYALPDQADADKLLFVATDRISAFDIIMDNVSILCRS